MKKTIIIVMLLSLVLTACSTFSSGTDQTVSDAEMATRIAQLLATMNTPTQEIDFPATPTLMAGTPAATDEVKVITATPEAITATPVVAMGEPATTTTPAATIQVPTATPEATATPAATVPPAGTATPTATATAPSTDPVASLGNPTGTDNFDSANTWTWPTDNDKYLRIVFSNGYMQMTGLTNFAGWRLPLVNQQVNTYIELTANSGACSGKDSYGIIYRVPVFKDPTQGYLYEVTCDGYYRLWKWDGKASTNGLATMLVPWKQSSAIVTGANQSNRLGVMVKGSTFTLYMNGVQLASASDGAYSAGFFGVFVRSAQTANYTVNFDTMKYWENP